MRREHLELLNRRLREVLSRLAGLGRHVHRPVGEVRRRELQRAGADLSVAAARARAVLAGAGQQERQRHRRAVGDRQHLDLLLRDDRRDLALRDFDDGCLSRHRDGFLQRAEAHRDVLLQLAVDREHQVRDGGGGEADQLRFHLVGAERERAEPVLAIAFGDRGLRETGVDVARTDGHAREDASLGISDRAANDATFALGRGRGRQPQRQQQGDADIRPLL